MVAALIGSTPLWAQCWWLTKIARADDRRRYRWFATLLGAWVASFISLLGIAAVVPRSSFYYAAAWLTLDAVHWGLWVATLTEAATSVVAQYRGFTKLGALIIRAGLTLSALLVGLLWTVLPRDWTSGMFGFWTVESYVVYGSLTLIALVFGAFVSYFRLVPDHNARVIYLVSTIVIVGNLATANLLLQNNHTMYYAVSFYQLMCFGYGAWAFRTVDTRVVSTAMEQGAYDASRAMRQLESLNETLSRLLK